MNNQAQVLWEGVHCNLAIDRPGARVVVIRLAGWDAGEFGDVPMTELAKDLAKPGLIELYVDARAVKGASIEVSGEWAQWLAKNRSRFAHISMLTGSRFIQLTANFVRRFADLGELMRIYTDPVAFDAALAQSIAPGKNSE
jgi:hypothetical protein